VTPREIWERLSDRQRRAVRAIYVGHYTGPGHTEPLAGHVPALVSDREGPTRLTKMGRLVAAAGEVW